jgi:replicative DNA helicase
MANDERELYKQAQRRLVASLVHNGESATRVFEIITPDDVEEPALNLVTSTILELMRTNVSIEVISIAHHLESEGMLAKAGGITELNTLRNEGRKALLEHPADLYAVVVRESSAKNKISQILSESKTAFKDDSGVAASDAVANLQSELNEELTRLSDESTSTEMGESIAKYLDLLEERKIISEENSKDAAGLQGIPSRLQTINKITTGWLPGQLITIGARTGVGKSVFAVNSAVAACEANKSVLFISLEMSDSEIQDRVMASMSGIPMNDLKQGRVKPEDIPLLEETSEKASKMKLLIETDPKITVDAIRAKALRRAQSEAGLDMIIVDYLQLITPVGRFASRQEVVADLSRNMKLLAKQLGIPVMVLVQLNRESKDEDENAIPKLDQIRESGSIAQDSDIVILIHRDKASDGEIPHTLVILAKHRNGKSGDIIRCHSNLACSLFLEVEKAADKARMSSEDFEELVDGLEDPDDDDFVDDDDDFEDLDID